jgi:hypothetical protein
VSRAWKVGEVADVVDEQRAALAARRRPAVHAGGEHEVVDDELAASVEQVAEARLAAGALEDVVLVDADHGLPASLGGQRVAGPGRPLLLGEQLFVSNPPLSWRKRLAARSSLPPRSLVA